MAKIDVIYGERAFAGIEAATDGGVWLNPAEFSRISGWELKPQGFCKNEQCYPIPAARRAEFVRDAEAGYNLSALADLIGQPVVSDSEHQVWCFGEAAESRKRTLTSLKAPDFTLPDLAGRMHSLSEYRGKKVLLVSWASW